MNSRQINRAKPRNASKGSSASTLHVTGIAPSAHFPELFGTRVRYSGASFGFQLSAAIGGGLAPVIATALTDVWGGTSGVSLMLIGLAVITFIAALFARETRDAPLHD